MVITYMTQVITPVSLKPIDTIGSYYNITDYSLCAVIYIPISVFILKNSSSALAGVAQWIECRHANQSVAGSIPSQGTCLGCRPGTPPNPRGSSQEATTH